MAKSMVQWGIKAFWNFAPIDLKLPSDIMVENVHLAESLMTLSYRIHSMEH
jgi:redox-sensing transcriptional repressor